MSLIHDALKKAEAEKKPLPSTQPFLNNPIISDKPKGSKRILFLSILLSVSFCFLITMRFIKKPKTESVPVPAPLATNAFDTSQNPIALKKMALQLYEENKLEKALTIWEKLTLLIPTEAEVYNNMGLTLKKLGRQAEAYQAYAKALALKKDYPELHNNLGALYLSDGQREEAKSHFQEALSSSKDYADPYFHLALIAEQEGNFKEAIDYYQEFLEKAPQTEAELKQKIQGKINRLSK